MSCRLTSWLIIRSHPTPRRTPAPCRFSCVGALSYRDCVVCGDAAGYDQYGHSVDFDVHPYTTEGEPASANHVKDADEYDTRATSWLHGVTIDNSFNVMAEARRPRPPGA